MKKNFNEKIKEITNEAMSYIRSALDEKGVEFVNVYDEEEEAGVIATAFDYNGEAYSIYVKEVHPYSVVTEDDDEIEFYDISCQSVARLADIVAEKIG